MFVDKEVNKFTIFFYHKESSIVADYENYVVREI